MNVPLSKLSTIAGMCFSLIGCAAIQEPIIQKDNSIYQYKFAILPKTPSKNSTNSEVIGGEYGVFGTSTSKQINPSAVIEGILLKRGITSIDSALPDQIDKTLIVKYGESGMRYIAGGLGGYTLEVTILLISAKTGQTIYSCTAEGQGQTESDDIREAILRCMSGI